MAAVTHLTSIAFTSNASSYGLAGVAPAVNDLLVVFVFASDSVDVAATLTEDIGGSSYALVGRATCRTSLDSLYCYVRNSLCGSTTTRTLTWATSDAATGCVIACAKVTGMARAGPTAIRQFDGTDNGAAAGTPDTVFPAVALTGNACIFGMGNGTNPATQTAPTSFTELLDTGYGSPTSGFQYSSRDSGHTSDTITQGGTSASAFGAFSVELDATAWPTAVPNLLNMAPQL